MSIIEWLATGFGVACVILTIRESIWCWPTGLVQVLLFVFVFLEARLYSDVVLHVIYVILQIYGWHAWLRGGDAGESLQVSRLAPHALLTWLVVGVVGTVTVGTLMRRFTDADYAYWDASILALSLIAQWLLARKVLESWIFWISVDVLAVGLYTLKGLYPTAGLYSVFLVLAVTGLVQWKRSLERQPLLQRA